MEVQMSNFFRYVLAIAIVSCSPSIYHTHCFRNVLGDISPFTVCLGYISTESMKGSSSKAFPTNRRIEVIVREVQREIILPEGLVDQHYLSERAREVCRRVCVIIHIILSFIRYCHFLLWVINSYLILKTKNLLFGNLERLLFMQISVTLKAVSLSWNCL